MWDEITYSFLNFNGCTVEVKEWMNNFIPHILMDVITFHMTHIKIVIFNIALLIGILKYSYDSVLRWMPLKPYWW